MGRIKFGVECSYVYVFSLIVTMQGSKEAPPSMQCKDKFLLQSVIAPNGATNKDISAELVGSWAPLF